MIIRVPATSANLGPGFDSIGIALSLYLTLETYETTTTWQVDHTLGDEIPNNADNMIIQTALKIAPNLAPHRISVTTDIPVARGLGSSSSAIVAGIELANQLANLNLTAQQKMQQAAKIEGHPDNVAPAIYGNLVIGASVNDSFHAVKTDFPNLAFVAYIPHYELKTADSRQALPDSLTLHQAAHASSIANTFIAALLTGDVTQAGELMEADEFHEPYRQKLVPELLKIRQIAHENHAIATYLSGAGPTVMTILNDKDVQTFQKQLTEHGLTDTCLKLDIDKNGLSVN
jgi:homoserine kinase